MHFQNNSEIQKGKTCHLLLNSVLEINNPRTKLPLFLCEACGKHFWQTSQFQKNEDFQQVMARLEDKTKVIVCENS